MAEGWGGLGPPRPQWEIDAENRRYARERERDAEINRLRREVDELKRGKRKSKKKEQK